MQQPKILVGCPTSEHKAYCLNKYADALKKLTYKNYDILLADNSEGDDYFKTIKEQGLPVIKSPYLPTARERIVHARNLLRQYALDHGYDYFFSLEQDVIPPNDILERLLQHGKTAIVGVYYMEYTVKRQGKPVGKKILPLLYTRKDEEHLAQLTIEAMQPPQLLPIAAAGLGCILIHRSVLEHISFSYVPEKLVFDDIWFCKDLEKQHVQLYADTSLQCLHLTREMDWDSITK